MRFMPMSNEFGELRFYSRVWVAVALIAFALQTQADDRAGGAYPEREAFGVVERLEFDRSSLIVNGLRFRVAIDAHVRINDGPGAYTMLTNGAKVHYIYRMLPDRTREIITLQTVERIPDDMIY
jgi:hypothetical protein